MLLGETLKGFESPNCTPIGSSESSNEDVGDGTGIRADTYSWFRAASIMARMPVLRNVPRTCSQTSGPLQAACHCPASPNTPSEAQSDGRGLPVRLLLPGRCDHGQDARLERIRQRSARHRERAASRRRVPCRCCAYCCRWNGDWGSSQDGTESAFGESLWGLKIAGKFKLTHYRKFRLFPIKRNFSVWGPGRGG